LRGGPKVSLSSGAIARSRGRYCASTVERIRPMSDNGIPSVSQITLAQVAEVVRKHYGEDIWQAVKIGLAVVLSLSLTGRDNCVVLVYEGASGQRKSITIRLLMSDRDSTARYLIRIDDFTPASFVSHAANRKASRLQQIDLLPRVKDKVMLTKELAPLFRDDEKELRQNFARLTSVLDGNGYVTASDSHGRRGYQGQYLFNWLGGRRQFLIEHFESWLNSATAFSFTKLRAKNGQRKNL